MLAIIKKNPPLNRPRAAGGGKEGDNSAREGELIGLCSLTIESTLLCCPAFALSY